MKLPVGSKYTLTECSKSGYTKRIPTTSTYVDGGEEPEITVGEDKQKEPCSMVSKESTLAIFTRKRESLRLKRSVKAEAQRFV